MGQPSSAWQACISSNRSMFVRAFSRSERDGTNLVAKPVALLRDLSKLRAQKQNREDYEHPHISRA